MSKAAQAEGHGLSVESGAVVKDHVLAQRDRHCEPVIADDRCCGGQTWLQLTRTPKAVKRIAQGTEQLNGADGARLRRVQELMRPADATVMRSPERGTSHPPSNAVDRPATRLRISGRVNTDKGG